jgi:uncharacterized protein (DUF1330 family)
MAHYAIFDVTITDPGKYKEYMLMVKPVIEAAGGRYLVRGGAHKVHEGDWNPTRLVVFEFPSEAAMLSFYESPEYRGLKAMRESCSRANLVSVEGV